MDTLNMFACVAQARCFVWLHRRYANDKCAKQTTKDSRRTGCRDRHDSLNKTRSIYNGPGRLEASKHYIWASKMHDCSKYTEATVATKDGDE